MTGQIIQLPGNTHREIQSLLPWYVTGQLDAADHARVLAHLDGCDECAAQVEIDRRLERELTRVPGDVETGWAAMSGRLGTTGGQQHARRSEDMARRPLRASRLGWRWVGLGVATQLAVASLLAVLFVVPDTMPARFEALGAADAPAAAGNLIVIFRPDTSERQLRETLRTSDARLVDGPTEANAYILRVPIARRPAVLTKLRGERLIVLAEPLDAIAEP